MSIRVSNRGPWCFHCFFSICECVCVFAIFISLSAVIVIEYQLGPILSTEINGDYEMDS